KDPSDDQYHGTHCAGTIGAVGNNGIGIAGVCHTVRLMALKFLSSSGSGTTSDAIQAVNYATANHATLTSNSWGGGGYSQILKDAIDAAGTAGVLFIASAGNNGRDTDLSPSYPASYDSANIISVAASDHRDELASFTNYGAATVDLAAPGVSVYSASPGSSYRYLSGTSMACPHVAGACALIKSAIPEMGWPELKAAILNNVDAVAAMDGKVGAKGRLNVARSLIQSLGPYVGVSSMQPSDNGLLGSMGNNDGLLNPGEDIAVTVNLKNVGTELAGQTQSTLSVISAGGKVTVLQGVKAWGDLEPGAAVNNGGAPFLIRIAPGTVTPHAFTLVLTTTATGGHTWTAQAQLTAYTSSVISGRVMAATGGAGIAGATVNYSGTATGSVLTGADGNYEIKLTDGFYQLRAAAPAYNPSAALPVTVPPSAQGLNFALGRSRLQVTPGALSSTQNEDTVVTKILTLTNEGDAPLNFSVSGLAEGASAAVALTKPPPVVSVLETADPPPAAPTSAGSKVATVAALPFAEGFESGSLSDWITDSGTGTREIVSTTAAVGARSFHYKSQGSNAHYNGIHRDFAAGATPASVSFWVRSGSTTTHDSYFVLTDPTYGATPIWFYANGYGRFYVNTDVGGDDTFNYQANVWYRVEFRDIDWKAKDFDYYVNGTLMKANIPFRNEPLVDEISALWLYNYSAGSEAWWDDIRLSQSIADWLTQTPGGGTLAPGQSLDLTVTFNAMDKLPGEYLGQIEISSDDLANPVVSVPVTMTVQMPPNTPPVAEA
ncbi:MAG TPA: S8 family serine peptidase, partial [Prosthecobacter sp.]|nr:S8 family serine peptidase [Prosthecobacter sp.]